MSVELIQVAGYVARLLAVCLFVKWWLFGSEPVPEPTRPPAEPFDAETPKELVARREALLRRVAANAEIPPGLLIDSQPSVVEPPKPWVDGRPDDGVPWLEEGIWGGLLGCGGSGFEQIPVQSYADREVTYIKGSRCQGSDCH